MGGGGGLGRGDKKEQKKMTYFIVQMNTSFISFEIKCSTFIRSYYLHGL